MIQDIPVELLLHIFDSVDDRPGLLRCVCSEWKNIIDNLSKMPLITLTDVLFESKSIYLWSKNEHVSSFMIESFLRHKKSIQINNNSYSTHSTINHLANLLWLNPSFHSLCVYRQIFNNYHIDLLPFVNLDKFDHPNAKIEILFKILFVIEPPSPNDTRLLLFALKHIHHFVDSEPNLIKKAIQHSESISLKEFYKFIDECWLIYFSEIYSSSFNSYACFNTIQLLPCLTSLCIDIQFTFDQFNQILNQNDIPENQVWLRAMAHQVLSNSEIKNIIKKQNVREFENLMKYQSRLFKYGTGCLSILMILIEYQFKEAIVLIENQLEFQYNMIYFPDNDFETMIFQLKQKGLKRHPNIQFINFMIEHLMIEEQDVVEIVLISYDSSIDNEMKNFLRFFEPRIPSIKPITSTTIQKMKDIRCLYYLLKNNDKWFFHKSTVDLSVINKFLQNETDFFDLFKFYMKLYSESQNQPVDKILLSRYIINDIIPYQPFGKRLLKLFFGFFGDETDQISLSQMVEEYRFMICSEPQTIINMYNDGILKDFCFKKSNLQYIDSNILKTFWKPEYSNDEEICEKLWKMVNKCSPNGMMDFLNNTFQTRQKTIQAIHWLVKHGCKYNSYKSQQNICLCLASLDRLDLYDSLFFSKIDQATLMRGKRLVTNKDFEITRLEYYLTEKSLNFLLNVDHLIF